MAMLMPMMAFVAIRKASVIEIKQSFSFTIQITSRRKENREELASLILQNSKQTHTPKEKLLFESKIETHTFKSKLFY
jgi:hypothetical protein